MATAASNNTWLYLQHFAQLYKMLPVHPASPTNDSRGIRHHLAIQIIGFGQLLYHHGCHSVLSQGYKHKSLPKTAIYREGKTTISISLVSLYWTRCNFSGIYDLYLTILKQLYSILRQVHIWKHCRKRGYKCIGCYCLLMNKVKLNFLNVSYQSWFRRA